MKPCSFSCNVLFTLFAYKISCRSMCSFELNCLIGAVFNGFGIIYVLNPLRVISTKNVRFMLRNRPKVFLYEVYRPKIMSTDISVVKVKGWFKCRTFHWPNLTYIHIRLDTCEVRPLNRALVISKIQNPKSL